MGVWWLMRGSRLFVSPFFIFSNQKLTILINLHSIGPNLTSVFHIGDHVPMNGAFIHSPALFVGLADGHVNTSTDFSIEQNIAGGSLGIVIGSNRHFWVGAVSCCYFIFSHLSIRSDSIKFFTA